MEKDKSLFDIIMNFASETAGSSPVDAIYALCGYARFLDLDQAGIDQAFRNIDRQKGATEDELRQAAVLKMLLDAEGLDSRLFIKYLPQFPSAFAHTPETTASFNTALNLVITQGNDDTGRLPAALIPVSQSLNRLSCGQDQCLRIKTGNQRLLIESVSIPHKPGAADDPLQRLMGRAP